MSDSAIGVFDSGLGGLTVLKALMQAMPHENFVYLGDTARLPYGTKSSHTIRKYTEQNLKMLLQQNVKALVIACNSASAQFPDPEFEGLPVFNVIEPGTRAALAKTKNRVIGLLGTKATVKSQAYERMLHRLSGKQKAELVSIPAPLLVPLAEEGWVEDPVTNLIVYRYVQPLVQEGVDTIILGCTHYPILSAAIQKAAGNKIQLVDSGTVLSEEIKEALNVGRIAASKKRVRAQLFTTDDPHSFGGFAEKILSPEKFDSLELINL